ncbi:MAG: LacI family DNA-binding transcriptional regulator [Planctomycetota bacterium]
MSKVTIEDISRHTGLSRGTVSRALNDRPDISPKTKQRVLEACRQLNYAPSHAARSLATGRRYAVAVVVADLRCSFATGYLRGVLEAARPQHYAVQISELGADAERALDHLRAMAAERVDGVLMASALPSDFVRGVLESLGERPCVNAAITSDGRGDVLGPDYQEAGRLAGRHVLPAAAPNVLYVNESGSPGAALCHAGFAEICGAHGVDPAGVTLNIPPAGSGDRLAEVRSRLGGVRAIVANHDLLAVELFALCLEAGRVPGRDIGLMGIGNELVGTRCRPALTTVDLAAEETGRRAMTLLIQRVTKERQDAPQQVWVAPTLVRRQSTALFG